jgi:transposase
MMNSEVLPFDAWEWRRFQAWHLKRQGWSRQQIAEALQVRPESLSHWMARVRSRGSESLQAHPSPGRPSRLTDEQKRLIPEFLWHGAEAYGFRGQAWTCARVARVLQEELGVTYHKGQVGKLLQALHWTPQMPIQRAVQREESAIERWRQEVWPQLQRLARQERRRLIFEDESGFYLLPAVVRTYAPQAQTPVLRGKLTHDHLSVMGGMTPEGKLYFLTRQHALSGEQTIEFLVHLLNVVRQRLLVIWDGSPIHRRREVMDWVGQSRGRVRVEFLPPYAPDLNPWDEGGWHHLKQVEMGNVICRDVEELHEQFHLAAGRLRQKPRLIHSFFAQAGLKM